MKIHHYLSSNLSLSFWNKLTLIDEISIMHLIFNLDLLDPAKNNNRIELQYNFHL
jgi:hypothetical protein